MRPSHLSLACSLALLVPLIALLPDEIQRLPAAPSRAAVSSFAQLPVAFEPNAGQSGQSVRFTARVGGSRFFFAPGEVILSLSPVPAVSPGRSRAQSAPPPGAMAMRFVKPDPAAQIVGGDPLPGKVNYLLGDDPSQWRTGLATYRTLTYREIYPGVSLQYEGTGVRLKGTYTVAPGANPGIIRWHYDGAQPVSVDGQGNLQLTMPGATVTEQAPVAWQSFGNFKQMVEVGYSVDGQGTVRFSLGPYDSTRPLVIDPVLTYSTYFGGNFDDIANNLTVDRAGNAYFAGQTTSTVFPVAGAYQPVYGGGTQDAYIAKLDPTGSHLLYATYLGGTGHDEGWGIAVDRQGDIFVDGDTDSPDFPTLNAFQPAYAGCRDAFITELDPTGSHLVYSTYLGGSACEQAWNLAVDSTGNAFATGETTSGDFPTLHAYQPTFGGDDDAFVVRVAPGGSLLYSTYLGGAAHDNALGIAIDGSDNAYITGATSSTNFPVVAPYERTLHGPQDGFVSKLDNSGRNLLYSTYLGGSGQDTGWAIAISEAGHLYVSGITDSIDFPTVNPAQPTNHGPTDSFVTRFRDDGSGLVYSTYLGGSGDYDDVYGIAVDRQGDAYVAGSTDSTDFPVVDAIQPANHGSNEAFITEVSPGGNAFIYSTYLGGSASDGGYGVALDPFGNLLVDGLTHSLDFPTVGAYQPSSAGDIDSFVAKISQACAINFTDVAPDNPFYPYIRCLVCAGAVSGYADGSFRPNNLVTRGQTAKMVAEAAGFNEAPGVQMYEDVPPASSFYAAAQRLTLHGAMSGYPCGQAPDEPCLPPLNRPYFRPNATATRGEIAKIMSEAAGFNDQVTGQTFQDVPPGSTFYMWVQRLTLRGVMGGYPCGAPNEPCGRGNLPYFRPSNSATRGQTAKIATNTFFPGCNPP